MDPNVDRAEPQGSPVEECWRALVENSPLGMAIARVDGSYTISNPAFSQMLGLSIEQIQHIPVTKLFELMDATSAGGSLARLGEENKQSVTFEVLQDRADAASIWLDVSIWIATETTTSPRFVVIVVQHVTERKSAELASRQHQEALEQEIESERQRLARSAAETFPAASPGVPHELVEAESYFEDETAREFVQDEIIGKLHGLNRAFQAVQTVAPADATVLLLGETGTGKELFARAIHNLSPRRSRPFVRADCASMPEALVENELFGHEKGAFTGATGREIGRLELADDGTLFLDEVGDIPPALQSKLLRILQEHEFERLGSTRTIRANFRLIAATNRNLAQMVEQARFRSDLFYRLNVFPISLPALRDRREDIPPLTWYFIKKYARRMNKSIRRVRRESMDSLVHYAWPGNVRELQNIIERAVVLSQGEVLNLLPLEETHRNTKAVSQGSNTLEDVEREHILRTLRNADWVIGGPYGAAAQLGMRRTTLLYKMRRLGIARPEK